MNSKTAEWRPGPSVCRCCLSEGCYKDISTEYFWMGKREVYAEMLADTFDLTIAYSKSKGPNSNSRLICEPCISRLRDATDFKRQVRECERTFLQHLDPEGSSDLTTLEVTAEPLSKLVKLEDGEEIKEENLASDFDDADDIPDFGDDDDDDLDDQPLTTLASKTPKKESVDFTDLLDNAKAEKRKSSSKAKASPAKKVKTKKEKVVAKPKPEKKKKVGGYDPARANAATLLRCTTAYPFRVNDKRILCVYCHDLYDDPDLFRRHMQDEHSTFNVKRAFYHLPKLEFVKIDLTDLVCRLCKKEHADLETIATHLTEEHDQKIDRNAKLGVMPYVLTKGVFCCYVCNKILPSLFHLNRHTISHFLSHVCDVCGKRYIASTGLIRHVRLKHHTQEVFCKLCKRVFPSLEAKLKHARTEKSCMPYVCSKCPERFHDFSVRRQHMELEHGATRETFLCEECDVSFATGVAYYDHFKLNHDDDCLACKHCGLKFTRASRLKRHINRKHLN